MCVAAVLLARAAVAGGPSVEGPSSRADGEIGLVLDVPETNSSLTFSLQGSNAYLHEGQVRDLPPVPANVGQLPRDIMPFRYVPAAAELARHGEIAVLGPQVSDAGKVWAPMFAMSRIGGGRSYAHVIPTGPHAMDLPIVLQLARDHYRALQKSLDEGGPYAAYDALRAQMDGAKKEYDVLRRHELDEHGASAVPVSGPNALADLGYPYAVHGWLLQRAAMVSHLPQAAPSEAWTLYSALQRASQRQGFPLDVSFEAVHEGLADFLRALANSKIYQLVDSNLADYWLIAGYVFSEWMRGFYGNLVDRDERARRLADAGLGVKVVSEQAMDAYQRLARRGVPGIGDAVLQMLLAGMDEIKARSAGR